MKRSMCGLAAGVLMAARLFAQPAPKIEVASIRVHSPEAGDRGGPQFSGNRLTVGGNLYQLIIYAYDLKVYQLSGGPSWATNPSTESDYYDITAQAEAQDVLTQVRARQLLQILLADRFQLKLRRDRKEMPYYSLVVGRGGPKFKESAPDAISGAAGSVGLTTITSTFTKSTMDALVRVLSSTAGRPVFDQTALPGLYDLKLEFARDPAAAVGESGPTSIFTAVQEQLGLKLESGKGPVEVFVIEQAQRPSAN